jgi:excisionase family DNA binding protein
LPDTTYSPTRTQEWSGDWLTPKDLQHELQIGQKLAYKLLKSGEIPSVRVGGLIRIYRPHLEEALLEDPELGQEKRASARTPQPDPLPKESIDDSTR